MRVGSIYSLTPGSPPAVPRRSRKSTRGCPCLSTSSVGSTAAVAQFRLEARPQFERSLAELTIEEQDEALRILDLLQVDPLIDGFCKTSITIKWGTFQFYSGSKVWVSYHLIANDVVSVLDCGRWQHRDINWM